MSDRVVVLDEPERVAALAHPLRAAVLDALRRPNSAAGVARAIGETRQKTNHHVKALLDVGLVRRVGERRTGNFVEQLYHAVAGTFVVSPRLAWGGDARAEALRRQVPLEQLVRLGERVQRDASALLDRAAFDGEAIPSLVVEAEVSFPDAAARAAFADAYLAAVKPLLARHGARAGDRYRVAIAVYPETDTGTDTGTDTEESP
jgi:DNA-binding transcriptional ArsR family regulator